MSNLIRYRDIPMVVSLALGVGGVAVLWVHLVCTMSGGCGDPVLMASTMAIIVGVVSGYSLLQKWWREYRKAMVLTLAIGYVVGSVIFWRLVI